MEGLDLNKFAGTWFTIERIPNQYVETASCIYTNYTVDGSGLLTHEFGKNAVGEAITIQSQMKANKPGEAMTVISDGVPEAPLKIVATDYDTYACLESCLQYPAFKAQFAWILTKKPASSIEAAKTCHDILKTKMSIDSSSFKKVKQGRGCEYPTWARNSN
ncbi:Lipocalin/cytosolic fatty-acid binding domain [Trinorchestia longiramus]|nr:Lipocalin/cytosolic fatty-acid binding domain [Trinorchestia longiramus]